MNWFLIEYARFMGWVELQIGHDITVFLCGALTVMGFLAATRLNRATIRIWQKLQSK